MPKTSDAIAGACSKLEIQPGCTGTWYDIGGEMNQVSNTKETREVGSVPVFNSMRHVTTGGKMPPITVTFSGLATEVDTEAFELVRGIWEAAGASDCIKRLCVRWTPKGGAVGDQMYEMTDLPELVGFMYPGPNAGEAGPIPFEFDVYGYIDTNTYVS